MCDFCERKKFLPMGYRGEGLGTMADTLSILFGRSDDETSGSGLQIVEENGEAFMSYDNSADEYGDGFAKINYCPMCGRKLNKSLA